MNITKLNDKQIEVVIFSLIKERGRLKTNAENLIIKFNNGEFKGKYHGPQNQEGLNELLSQFDTEIAEITELIETFEEVRLCQ